MATCRSLCFVHQRCRNLPASERVVSVCCSFRVFFADQLHSERSDTARAEATCVTSPLSAGVTLIVMPRSLSSVRAWMKLAA